MDSSLKKSYKRLFILAVCMWLVYLSPIWVTKTPFTKADLEWIDGLSERDRLIFRSDESDIYDTIQVMFFYEEAPTDYVPFLWSRLIFPTWLMGNVGPYHSYIYIPIFGTFKGEKKNGAIGSFSMIQKEFDKPAEISIMFDSFNYNHTYTSLDSILFNNKSIPVLRINKNTSEIGSWSINKSPYFSEVIWSKPYGIIEYTLTSGEKYHLVEYRHADGRVEKFSNGE